MAQQDDEKYTRRWSYTLGRWAVTLVWIYQGLWCKLLSGCPSHSAIVHSLPSPLSKVAHPLLYAIGAVELGLGVWVLTGWQPRLAAWAQTLLLVCMNAGGLIWGRGSIADPAGVVIQNLAFLALVWIIADEGN